MEDIEFCGLISTTLKSDSSLISLSLLLFIFLGTSGWCLPQFPIIAADLLVLAEKSQYWFTFSRVCVLAWKCFTSFNMVLIR